MANQETTLDQFRQLSFLSELTADEWHRVRVKARKRELTTGEQVLRVGGESTWARGLFLVSSGLLGVMVFSPEGQQLCARTVKPGQLFFTPALFDGGQCPASLEALQRTRCWFFPRHVLLPVLTNNPQAADAAFGALAELLREAQQIIEGLAFKGNRARLAAVLLEIAAGNVVDRRAHSLEFLASRINTVPEVVSRLLHQLAKEDLLAVDRSRLTIVDRAGLEQITSID